MHTDVPYLENNIYIRMAVMMDRFAILTALLALKHCKGLVAQSIEGVEYV